MIKLRLHGTEEEIARFLDKLRSDDELNILSESDPYKDRGKSQYSRVYMDIEQEEGK